MVNTGPAAGWRAPSRESRDTLFMLALIGWTILPHLQHLAAWVGVLAYGVLAWRARLALRQAPLPGRVTVLALLVLASALTFWGQRTLIGKESGVTLLVVLMALKTLELRARRDAMVVFFLGFFLVLTAFLYSQSLLVAAMTALAVWGWLTALTLAHMPAGQPTIGQAAAHAGRAALVGTPVMIVLFLLFPRIGPLWAVPSDQGRTGLSDHLEMGSIAELAADDTIAFRLRFDGPRPPGRQMYFRGPVLTDSDGHDWQAARGEPFPHPQTGRPVTAYETRGAPVRFEMTLEPTQNTWLPLLELVPQPGGSTHAQAAGLQALDGMDPQALPDLAGQWRTRRPIGQRLRLRAQAWPDGRIVDATPEELRRSLALPPGAHPRTRDWASRWLATHAGAGGPSHPDVDALESSLLRFIATEGFSYTLSPGAYEGDPVDEFWLDRRAGFCEHYATAFVVALRAMGVPARVVTGYQGADPDLADGYVVVRQSNAHAWAEVWHEGVGWMRADPTAAIAPDRIRQGRALRPRPGLIGGAFDAMSPGLLERLRGWREVLDNRWNVWVLGYDRRSQFDLMKLAGLSTPDTDDLGRMMIVLIAGVSGLMAAFAWWDAHRRTPGQRVARRLARALRPLAPHGMSVSAHDSAGTLARAARDRFGSAANPLAKRLEALERDRYGPPGAARGAAADWQALGAAASALASAMPPRTP